MTDADAGNIPTLDTSPEGLDAFADSLAADFGIDRDALRAKLAEFEGVAFDPERGRAVRMVEHEIVGDWRRATFEPFLRVIPGGAP